MKTPIASRAFAALTLLFAVTACENTPTVADNPTLSISTKVSRTQFRAGDSTTITTTISNYGDRAVEIVQPLCVPYFEVRSTRGDSPIVGPGQYPCAVAESREPPSFGRFTIAAQQTRTFTELWFGDNRSWQVLLSAGVYTVRGSVQTSNGAVLGEPTQLEILSQ